jgi:hypothetical protein
MDRRTFVASAATSALALLSPRGSKATITALGPAGPMGLPMRAWVAQPSIVRQDCPEWCWAASISMIFAAHGHPIDQQIFVLQKYHGLACAPAGVTITLAQDLSAPWTDKKGVTFQSIVSAAFDPSNGIYALNNQVIVDELSNNRPLLYCNTHHAMVLVSADFYQTPMGPNIISCGVLDPWPYSPAYHPLSTAEIFPVNTGGQMTFLAAVQTT